MEATKKLAASAAAAIVSLWCAAATVNVRDLGAKGNGVDDDWIAFRDAFEQAPKTGSVVVNVPAGTYKIGQPLVVYSNTTLNLDANAKIIPMNSSVIGLLRAQHLDANGKQCPMDETCKHGGHSQIENVKINGGVWDLNTADGAEVTYIMHLWHGQNIKVSNLTCKGNINHFLNFSGSRNVMVENVTFLPSPEHPYVRPEIIDDNDTGSSGFSAREAIHLDFITVGGEAGAFPIDGTPCKDITISGCTFRNVVAGVGTHRHFNDDGSNEEISLPSERITVTNCVFDSMLSYAVSMFYFRDSVIAGNRVTIAPGSDVSGLRVVGASTVRVENNELSSIGAHGISLEAEPGERLVATVSGNTVDTTGEDGNGIYAGGSDVSATIIGNTVKNAGKNAVQVERGVVAEIKNNIFASAGTYGVCVRDGAKVVAVENEITAAANSAFYFLNAGNSSITGNKITDPLNCGIQIGGSECNVANNEISGARSHGISIIDASNVSVSVNTVSNSTDHGIYVGADCKVGVTGSTVGKTGKDGVHAEDGADVKVSGSSVAGAAGYGMCALNGAKIAAVGNEINEPSNSAFYLLDAADSSIVSNRIYDVRNCGIQLGGSVCKIVDNSIRGARSHGISMTGASRVTATGNFVADATDHGVYVGKNCKVEMAKTDVNGTGKNGFHAEDGATVKISGSSALGAAGYGVCALNGAKVEASDILLSRPKNSGVYLLGAGDCVFRRCHIFLPGGMGVQVQSSKCVFEDGEVSSAVSHGVSVSGGAEVEVRGGSVSNSGEHAFVANDAGTKLSVTGCEVEGAGKNAVNIDRGASAEIAGSDFSGIAAHGIVCQGGSSLVAKDNALALADSGQMCVFVDSAAQCVVEGNEFSGSHSAVGALRVVSCSKGARIVDNTVSGAVARGIRLESSSGCVVSGNDFLDVGREGIDVADCTGVEISSNVVTGDANPAGIRVQGASTRDITLTANLVDVRGTHGIRVEQCAGCTASGNICLGDNRGFSVDASKTSGVSYTPGDAYITLAQHTGETTARVEWRAGSFAKAFRVEWADDELFTSPLFAEIGDSSQRSFDIAGLDSAKRYFVRVKAVESVNGSDAMSPGCSDFARKISYDIDFTCTEVEGGVRIDGMKSSFYRAIEIPAEIDGKAVVSIGDNAFAGCDQALAVSIPDTVSRIGSNAFAGCNEAIFDRTTKPGAVLVDGWAVGFGDDAPSSLDLTGLRGVADFAFANCTALESLCVPEGFALTGDGLFTDCTSLSLVEFAGDAPECSATAFAGVPETCVAYVERGADGWGDVPSLWNGLNLAYLQWIVEFDFSGVECAAIAPVSVANGETLGSLLPPSTADDTVEFLGWFDEPNGAGEELLPGTAILRDIVAYAFWHRTVPQTIVFDAAGGDGGETFSLMAGEPLQAPVVTRDGFDFAGWSPEPDSIVPGEDATYTAIWTPSAPAVWKTATVAGGVAVKGVTGGGEALVIPSSINGKPVVAIADFAFFNEDGKKLTSVKIPGSVKTIGVKAFKKCTNLVRVSLPQSLATLGQAAFQDCTSLTEVDVPALGDNYFWSSTFEGCTSLKRVSLPEGITAIGTSSFANCKALVEVNIPSTVKTIKSFAFFSCESLADVELPAGLAKIEQKAFKNCMSMAAIEIPSGVTSLGKAVFFNSGLVEVTVPGGIAKVDDYCFQKCAALRKVTLSEGVKETGASVWANDAALEEVVFPKTLEKLGGYAFFRCPSFATLWNFSNLSSLAAIGEKAFKHCTSLKTLTMPSQVTSLPKEMCNYCSSLEGVYGTANVTSIGQSAFSNCPSLKTVAGLDAAALEAVKRGREWKK